MEKTYIRIDNADFNIATITAMTFPCFQKIYAGKLQSDIKALYKQITGRDWDSKHKFAHLSEDVITGLKKLGYTSKDWMRFDAAKPAMLIEKQINKVAHDKNEVRKAELSKMRPEQYNKEVSKS